MPSSRLPSRRPHRYLLISATSRRSILTFPPCITGTYPHMRVCLHSRMRTLPILLGTGSPQVDLYGDNVNHTREQPIPLQWPQFLNPESPPAVKAGFTELFFAFRSYVFAGPTTPTPPETGGRRRWVKTASFSVDYFDDHSMCLWKENESCSSHYFCTPR